MSACLQIAAIIKVMNAHTSPYIEHARETTTGVIHANEDDPRRYIACHKMRTCQYNMCVPRKLGATGLRQMLHT